MNEDLSLRICFFFYELIKNVGKGLVFAFALAFVFRIASVTIQMQHGLLWSFVLFTLFGLVFILCTWRLTSSEFRKVASMEVSQKRKWFIVLNIYDYAYAGLFILLAYKISKAHFF
jgi:predicted cobalt transporter CbtA